VVFMLCAMYLEFPLPAQRTIHTPQSNTAYSQTLKKNS